MEPIPELANRLRLNASSSGGAHINVVEAALGNPNQDAESALFNHIREAEGLSGIVQRADLNSKLASQVEKIYVQFMKIDDLSISNPHLRFIKLDLEGGESHALLGSRKTLEEGRPLLVFENGREESAKLYSYSRNSFFHLFETTGYQLFNLFGRPFSISNWKEERIPWYFIGTSRSHDIIFVSEVWPNLVNTIYKMARSIEASLDEREKPKKTVHWLHVMNRVRNRIGIKDS